MENVQRKLPRKQRGLSVYSIIVGFSICIFLLYVYLTAILVSSHSAMTSIRLGDKSAKAEIPIVQEDSNLLPRVLAFVFPQFHADELNNQ